MLTEALMQLDSFEGGEKQTVQESDMPQLKDDNDPITQLFYLLDENGDQYIDYSDIKKVNQEIYEIISQQNEQNGTKILN